jgi:hypothetical protein
MMTFRSSAVMRGARLPGSSAAVLIVMRVSFQWPIPRSGDAAKTPDWDASSAPSWPTVYAAKSRVVASPMVDKTLVDKSFV